MRFSHNSTIAADSSCFIFRNSPLSLFMLCCAFSYSYNIYDWYLFCHFYCKSWSFEPFIGEGINSYRHFLLFNESSNPLTLLFAYITNSMRSFAWSGLSQVNQLVIGAFFTDSSSTPKIFLDLLYLLHWCSALVNPNSFEHIWHFLNFPRMSDKNTALICAWVNDFL